MPLSQKSLIEGARAFGCRTARLNDRAARTVDGHAEALADLLVPVVKAVLTDRGCERTVRAPQVWGGHGRVEDNGMSQHVRDARTAMICEGANGVQALDLVGRKLAQNGGAALKGSWGWPGGTSGKTLRTRPRRRISFDRSKPC